MNREVVNETASADESSSRFELRHASTLRPLLVTVPDRRLLAIHGVGSREAVDFSLATTVLRTVGETVRRILRGDRQAEPTRPVLEVTWPVEPGLTVDEIVGLLSSPTRHWRQMIELPRAATELVAAQAIDETQRSAGRDFPLVRLVRLTEGLAAQVLHLGRYDELASIRKLYAFVAESGYQPAGDLHELVVADPAVVGRARARSILRSPIADARARTRRGS